METTRICRECKIEHPIEYYYTHNGARTSEGYRRPVCNACSNKHSIEWRKNNPDKCKIYTRKSKLKKKYGMSIEDYDIMYAKQNGVCYICNVKHERRPLNVDHCHDTGKIRKLLCDKCNMALGLINDSIELLDKFKKYLKEHK
jgi:hypothetical protein